MEAKLSCLLIVSKNVTCIVLSGVTSKWSKNKHFQKSALCGLQSLRKSSRSKEVQSAVWDAARKVSSGVCKTWCRCR